MYTKDDIIILIRNNILLTGNHTIDILNTVYILSRSNVKFKLKQGWKINISKKYCIEAYLYIELYIKNKRYFIDVTDDVYINRSMTNGLFKKRPSKKYIASKILN